MIKFWKQLIDCGNKAVGSDAHQQAEELIFASLKQLSPAAEKMEFTFDGWETSGNSFLQLSSPFYKNFDCWIFLGSGSGSFEGEIHPMGYTHVWNMYPWKRFAVIDKGKIVAYISGRNDGDTLSQTLIEGNSLFPHFILGKNDIALLEGLTQGEGKIYVKGFAGCRHVSNMRGCNLILPIKSGKEKHPGKVVLTAHYDTMYNTPGAYDNAAGAAVLMQLAKIFSEKQPSCNLELVFTDAEEHGLAGSRYYANQISPETIEYVINIDGVGRGDELEIWSGNESFEQSVFKILNSLNYPKKQCYRNPPPPGSDHDPFYRRGIPSCMLTFNDQGILHTPFDIYEESKLSNMHVMCQLVQTLLDQLPEQVKHF